MTTLDELKSMWEANDRKLDESVRLNRVLLRGERLRGVRAPLRQLIFELSMEIAASAVAMALLGNFFAQPIAEARFVWPAALLDLWLLFCIVASARQLVRAKRIAYDGPVATIQGQLGELRILRVRTFRVALLSGQIVWWIPFSIVALKMLFGIDAYRFLSAGVIAVNLLFGVAVIPAAIWMTKRFGHRFKRSGWMGRLADEIAGRSLSEAQRTVTEIVEFEKA